MATAYSFTRPAILSGLAAQREDAVLNARPTIEGKAMAQQLLHRIEVEKLFGRFENVPALQDELRPMLHYFLEAN